MPQTSARLAMPYLMDAQAQKHIPHNEAIERLDALVQMTVHGFGATTPPASPSEGEVWAIGSQPVNEWAGQDDHLGVWSNGGWYFVTPGIGWRATLGTELRVWDGSDWVFADLPDLQNLDGVGVATSWDNTNRLAVASSATLLTHAGAGHQLKINKQASSDSASLLYQTNWSGRVEMGMAGSDDFSLKVSADGSAWTTAMGVDGSTGRVSLDEGTSIAAGNASEMGINFANDLTTGFWQPGAAQIAASVSGNIGWSLSSGQMQVNVPITGAAVQTDGSDISQTNRLVRTDGALAAGLSAFGDYADASAGQNINAAIAGEAGLFHDANPGTWPLTPAGHLWWVTTQRLYTGDAALQEAVLYSATGTPLNDRYFRLRADDGTWGAWQQLHETRSTGPNGTVIRFPSGLQICEHTVTLTGGGGDSIVANWTFPASFVSNPHVQASLTTTPAAGTRARSYSYSPSGTSVGITAWLDANWPASTSEQHTVTAIGQWM